MSFKPDSSADHPQRDAWRERLSAAADGEADALDAACSAWRDDAVARATWHRYHLIGDVMRSSELAAEPAHDAAFLARLRDRLATEPVVLAPQPAVHADHAHQAGRPGRTAVGASVRAASRWWMPATAAAGVMAVAGVLVVSRLSAPEAGSGGAGPVLATAPAPSPSLARVNVASPASAPFVQADSNLLRDARVDEYLRAHQAARGGIPMAAPGGGLRRVDAQVQPVPPR